MNSRSLLCSEQLRTSLASASGSRTRATLWSPPPTRRAPTLSSRRSSLTPRSSSPPRKSPSSLHVPIPSYTQIVANDASSFHPGYLTPERLAKAKNLKIAITAGIGSDHVDLPAANKTNGGITVAEVTGSNVVSVAEHVVMTILVLLRNFVPAHEQVAKGNWDVAAVAKQEYDLEGKVVGTVAVGRIGERVLRRLKPFGCKELLYFDYQPLSAEKEAEIGCRRVDSLEEMLAQCDVVTINCPLHEKTKGLFNKELISKMKPGSYLVNTARGAIVVKEDVAAALKSGHLAGYGGDVWFPQPAPADHPLRTAVNPFGFGNAMTPHMSGTSLDAQKRYADGTKAILESYLTGKHDYRPEDLITYGGDWATRSYGQREKINTNQ